MVEYEEQLTEIIKVSMRIMTLLLNDKTITDGIAQYCRNLYDALINQGFSEEEALRIVCSLKFPELGRK